MAFESAYRHGSPPWDIDGPQPALVRLAEQGAISGSVIDVGCGTGENALYLVSLGLEVVGVDAAPTAIERAEAKAGLRELDATFLIADALALESLRRTFDTAIDCGLFHTFSDGDRLRFERSLHAILRPRARYFLLCFSEHEPGDWGPRRVSQAEIRATFETGWRVDAIAASRFAANIDGGAAAWLASITRT
jgi:SAM-dependent methyltransferase